MTYETRNQRVPVGAVEINVTDWGGSPPVLFLAHATGFLGAVWKPVIDELRDLGFDGGIVTFDQRGHGLSSKPDRGYDWSKFADDVEGVMQTLRLDGLVGVGHSAGATTLATVAARAPKRFRRLVLIDPILFDVAAAAARPPGDNPMAARTRNRRLVWSSRRELAESYRGRPPYETWTEEALSVYAEHGTFERPDGEIELLCPGRIEAQVYESSTTFDGYAELARLRVPALVVRGARSDAFSAARAERAMASLGEGRLLTLDEASHYIPMEMPGRVAQLVLAELNA